MPTSATSSRREPEGHVYVVGLLATTDVELDGDYDDRWMAVDFAVWRDLLSEADTAHWFASAALDSSSFAPVIGDPHAQRLKLPSIDAGITFVPKVYELKQAFTNAISRISGVASGDDMLVIILCGHGEEGTGDILVGGQGFMDNPLTKRIVEDAVDGINIPQDQVFLVSTACYSGLWRSPKWTLLAGAEACDESIAMAQSGSGEFRGGVSTYAALAERADEFGLTAPHPIAMQYDADAVFADDQFRRNHSTVAGKLSSPRTLESPRRSGTKAYEFMDALRKTMRHTYAVSKSVLDLGSDTPSTFLLRPFTAEYGERLVLIGASPGPPSKPEIPRSASGSRCNVRTPRPPPPPPPLPLSTVDAKELLCLAREHARFPRADTARDLTVNALAKKLSAGGTLIPSQQKSLLARLRYRARACRRASAMAHYLGWAAARPVEEWGNPSGSKEMREAEEAGAAIATQFISPVAEGAYMGEGQPVWRTMGPGAWLAEAWVKAGRPHVEAGRSDAAVEFANQAADAGGSLARGQMYVDFKE